MLRHNYDKLFNQLIQLIEYNQVWGELDNNMKQRIDSLIKKRQKKQTKRMITELTCDDNQPLFCQKKEQTMSNRFLKITLDQSYKMNGLNKKKSINNQFIKKKSSNMHKTISRQSISAGKKSLLNLSKSKSKQKIKYNTEVLRSIQNSKRNQKTAIINSNSNKNIAKKLHNIVIPQHNKKQSPCKTIVKTFNSSSKNKQTIVKRQSSLTNFSKQNLSKQKVKSIQKENKSMLKKSFEKRDENNCHHYRIYQPQRQISKENKQNQDGLSFFKVIEQKQQFLNEQKTLLKDEINNMKELIQKQKYLLLNANRNIQQMNSQIGRKKSVKKQYNQDSKLSRIKNQFFFGQNQEIQLSITQTNLEKNTVQDQIMEQQYLITMYITVIDQIKNQLKIQQNQKLQLIKRLMVLKNIEKGVMEKYLSKQALNSEIFRTTQQSLKKWL